MLESGSRGQRDSTETMRLVKRLAQANLKVDDRGGLIYRGRDIAHAAREAGKTQERLLSDILGIDVESSAVGALAAKGRGGDTEIAHLTPGELVVHPEHLSPATVAMIRRDLKRNGIDLDQVRVGSRTASRNPKTGAQEFRKTQENDEVWPRLPLIPTPGLPDPVFELPAPREPLLPYGPPTNALDGSTGDIIAGPSRVPPHFDPWYAPGLVMPLDEREIPDMPSLGHEDVVDRRRTCGELFRERQASNQRIASYQSELTQLRTQQYTQDIAQAIRKKEQELVMENNRLAEIEGDIARVCAQRI